MEQQFRPRMKRLGDGLYLVESTSTPGIGHQVDVARGRCGCTAGRFNKRCHHLTFAESFDTAYQAWRAQATRPVTPAAVRASSTGTSGMAALMEAFG